MCSSTLEIKYTTTAAGIATEETFTLNSSGTTDDALQKWLVAPMRYLWNRDKGRHVETLEISCTTTTKPTPFEEQRRHAGSKELKNVVAHIVACCHNVRSLSLLKLHFVTNLTSTLLKHNRALVRFECRECDFLESIDEGLFDYSPFLRSVAITNNARLASIPRNLFRYTPFVNEIACHKNNGEKNEPRAFRQTSLALYLTGATVVGLFGCCCAQAPMPTLFLIICIAAVVVMSVCC